MRPVVAEWDEALRADLPAYARLVPEAEARRSVLRPSATAEEVAALEARLGVELPPSYRSFLLISNGAEAGGFGANYVKRLFEPDRQDVLRARDVIAFADSEFLAWLVEMWGENMGEFVDGQELPTGDAPAVVYDFEPGARALLVTEPVQDGTVGLVPFPEEWQVWEFFHIEVVAHQSFATYLKLQARRARQRVAERAERVRLAVADGSSLAEVEDLADYGDPRAVDAACMALLDDRHADGQKAIPAHRLVCIGDPKAIPGIRAGLAHLRDRRNRFPPDPNDHTTDWERDVLERFLLMALDSCGDTAVVAELERIAASSTSLNEWAAIHLKTRDELPRW